MKHCNLILQINIITSLFLQDEKKKEEKKKLLSVWVAKI